MRLMFVITRGDSAGGAQMHVRDMTRRLHEDGHEVFVVAGSAGLLTDELTAAGITTTTCPGLLREVDPINDIRAVGQLASMIRAFKPDLITTHSSKAGTIGRVAAKLANKPCIFTVHGWAFIETVRQPVRGMYRVLERGTASLASRIICVSEQVHGMGIAAGVSRKRMVVIRNGMPDVPAALQAEPGAESPRAVMVARFAAPKDHATVIRALALAPEVELDFVGDGRDLDAAKQLAAVMGVADRIQFLGARHDVPEILARSHIFVLSSHSEGFPISTLEAMRAGLPVIISNVGGAPEAVRPGETGFVVNRADPADLAAALTRLTTDAGLRMAMGAAGRRYYESDFTFEHMYAQTLSVYEAVAVTGKQRRTVLEA